MNNHGVGEAIAKACKVAKIEPEVTVPPYTTDCIIAAIDPPTGPVTAKPITPNAVSAVQVSTPMFNNYNRESLDAVYIFNY